jgi:L-ascorbate metabolism protein UlaG (beta-lactamase superfamily)
MPSITWHGHACFLLEHEGARVIIDPFLTGNPKAVIGTADLPPLDAILLTHGHGDHLGDAIPLARANRNAVLVAPYELALYCAEQGAPNVHPMNIGGFTTHPAGLVVTMGGVRVYHTGDTALTLDMQLLERRVDVMCAAIGDNYTMGPEDAARAVAMVRPRTVIPMHFGTFPVLVQRADDFVREVGATARVLVLAPGETRELPDG